MGKSSISFICVLFVISALWNPALTCDKCPLTCKGSAGSPSFVTGHKYTYAVEGVVSIFLTGADKQETSAKLSGQVSVAALGNCAHVLRVINLQISGPDGKKYGKPIGIEKPVQFLIEDGQVGSDICAEDGDNQRSLNIKRAIISLLHSAQKTSSEVDVFGVCPTEASSSQEGGAVLLHRSRDLNRCGFREQGKNDLVSAIYNPSADIKSSQILQSSLNVESKLKNGVPEKVSASEEYLYRPFSIGQSGARARVETKLTLSGQAAGADAGKFTTCKSIIFENPHPVNTDHNNQANVLLALKSTVQSLGSNAGSKSAGIFAQLIKIFRVTSKADLLSVYNQIKTGSASKDNNLSKRVFLDALVRAGTGDAIEVSLQLLKNKELSSLEQKIVFLSLGNVRHASSDSLKAAAGILDLPDLPKEVYLGVGALAGAYCREHKCHGETTQAPGVGVLSQKFASKLQGCKPKTKLEEDTVVAVLKGIRNIRHIENNLVDKLVACVLDKDVKQRVKVAALEAFHADPCTTKLKTTAIDIMKNRQLDSEIRIKAFLALVDCPCGKVANELKALLDTEPVHQVGRFISSTLRAIRASANPDRELAKHHFGQISTPMKFNVDDRKYSYFREFSYNVDALGLGATVEQSVIFSQDSFLPRSASLNLTSEVFGHNLNILEFGGRQGNLDRVLEHFYGPKGFFRTHTPQEIYDTLLEKFSELNSKIQQKVGRSKRAVQQEIANFAKQVKGETTSFHNELDLDIYVKIFGTDAVFLSLGDDKGFNVDAIIDKLLQEFDIGTNEAKSFSNEFRANVLFLDAELAYPTSSGLTLKLDLTGAATGRLEYGGSVDIKQIIKDPKNGKIDIKLIPSTNIEVAGTFVVDADVISTGLKLITSLHTSTGGHLIAKVLENGKGFDVQFALPVDKQEILHASNDLVFVIQEKGQQETEKALKIDGDRKEYAGCFDQLANAIGLTFCGELSVPFALYGPDASASIQKLAARYPLTGPTKVAVYLEKSDLRGYHVKGVLRDDNPQKRSFELILEAEGTKNTRRTAFSGELINTAEEKTAHLELKSPIKSASGTVSFITRANEYAGLVKLTHDKDEYYGRVGFNVQGNEKRRVFTPIVEYQMPADGQTKKSLNVEGQVIQESQAPAKPGYKYSFNGVKVIMPSGEKVQLDGFLANEPRGHSIEVKAIKGDQNMKLNGLVDGPKAHVEFVNSLNPAVNFKLDAVYVREEGHVQNDINLVFGQDFNSPVNRFVLNQNLKYHCKDYKEFDVITKNKLQIPILQLEGKVDGEFNPKKIDLETEFKYQNHKAELELEGRSNIKKPGDYYVKFETSVDDKGIEFLAKRDIVSDEKCNFENHLELKPGGKYELNGVVTHKFKGKDVNFGVVGVMKMAAKGADYTYDIGLISNPQQYSSHAKLTASGKDLVDYLMKVTKGPSPSGQLKFILKEAVVANGNFKFTENDGRGNGALIVDFKNLQRKIKADVKFQAKQPIYTADVDLYLNFEKNNNERLQLSTNTHCQDGGFDSKNSFTYEGKKTEVNMKKSFKGDFPSGDLKGEVELILPGGRNYKAKLDRSLAIKDDVHNGHADIFLSASSGKGPASTFTYKGKVTDTNYEKETLNYEGKMALDIAEMNKKMEAAVSLKNIPSGDRAKFDFKTDVTGTLLPKPLSIAYSEDYKKGETFNLDSKEKLKASYGEYSIEAEGVDQVKVFESEDKKFLNQYSITVNLPFEKAHDIKINSNTMFLLPANKDTFVEFTVAGSVQVNADAYKVDSSGKVAKSDGYYKIKLSSPQTDPFSLDTTYKTDLKDERKNADVSFKTTYGKGKTANINVAVSRLSHQEYTFEMKANAPQADKLKKIEVKFVGKVPNSNSHSSNLIVDIDGQVYKGESLIQYSRTSPLIDLKYTCPHSNKVARIFGKTTRLNEHHGLAEIKLENLKDVNFALDVESDIGPDHVLIKIDANSEKLNLKKYHVDITSKDQPNGKRLEFHATNDGKNIVSGSTSYINKQEGSKTIVEGSGSVKVNEEQKSATFKYIRDLLNEGTEQGVESFFNVAIGDRSIVMESRLTNLENKQSFVYCEEKKQCAHAEANSKLNVATQGVVQHTVNVNLDLRKLGFSPEFGIQMNSEVSDQRLPQYTLDVHLNQDQNRYHLHAYAQPKQGNFPAGITLNLPKRVIALESHLTYPEGKSLPFPIKGEAAFYLNKNHAPNQKAAVRLFVDVTGSGNDHNAIAELGFSHPALGKEALARFRGNLARPADNTVKFETSSTFSHPAFGKDRESKVLFELSPQNVKLLIVSPLVQIVSLEGHGTVEKDMQRADLTFSILNDKPVGIHVFTKSFQSFEFSAGYKDNSLSKLMVTGRVEAEKRVDVSADLMQANSKKNLAHGALYLDDNLLKTDYGASADNFKHFVESMKGEATHLGDRLKQLAEQARVQAKTDVEKGSGLVDKLIESYKGERQKLLDEMVNDKTLQEINQLVDSLVKSFAKIMDEIIQHSTAIIERMNATIRETFAKINEIYEQKLGPQLKELYNNIAGAMKMSLDAVIDVVSHFAAIVQDFFDKHKAELKELTDIFVNIFKDLTRLLVARLKEIREKYGEMFTQFFEGLKEAPFFAMLKERYEDFAVPEQVLAFMQEGNNMIKTILPTEETRNFADALTNYLSKKLNQQKIDDAKELRTLYEKLVQAVVSVTKHIRSVIGQNGMPSLFSLNALMPFSSSSPATSLPVFSSGFSFSPLNYLKTLDMINPIELFKAYRLKSLDPRDEFPTKMRGLVVNGQHIFTFDGRHLTFPGTCRYVLAHDHADNNFTLVVQLNNGAPKAIVLADKSGIVELREDGKAASNGQAHGFPVINEENFAFRDVDGNVGLGSKYGVMVFCTPKLTVCRVEVSGFYLGKLRGLLGDGNHETFDDFRLPNGRIATTEAEFGNSYRLTSGCAQVKTPDHSAHDHHSKLSAACEEVFGPSSVLRPVFLFQDVGPFRQACAHATAGAKDPKEEACDLARGYVMLAHGSLLPAVLPPACVMCVDADQPHKLGDEYKLSVPNKKADIVVVFDDNKANEEMYQQLLVPLMGAVVDGYKAKQIDDVKVHLVGLTSAMPYPVIYDVETPKLRGAKAQFRDEPYHNRLVPVLKTQNEKVDELIQKFADLVLGLQIEFGVLNKVAAGSQLMRLQLRPDALRTSIAMFSEPSHQGILAEILSLPLAGMQTYLNHATYLITPTDGLTVGSGKQASQIIGFDKHSVIMLGDKKKGVGTEALRATLSYPHDFRISYTLNTPGAVFSSTNFKAMNAGQRKQFTSSAAQLVVERSVHLQLDKECVCGMQDALRARSMCTISNRKEAASRRK